MQFIYILLLFLSSPYTLLGTPSGMGGYVEIFRYHQGRGVEQS